MMNPACFSAPATRVTWAVLALCTLAGCTTLNPDSGFGPVAKTAQDRLGKDLTWARSDAERDATDQRVAQLLAQPLSADDAV